MRRALAVVAAVMFVCGCNGNESSNHETMTIAFLRAVAGAPSTEPEFVAELRRGGFREGLNLVILAGGADEAYPDADQAAAAVRRWREADVDLIVALSTSGARVARDEAPDVDVLFLSNDPTAAGLVGDESAPEGRLTGASFRVPADRTLDLVGRVVPGLSRIGLAYPPDDPAATAHRDVVQDAADTLGIRLVTAEFTDAADAAAAVDQLAADGVQAILLSTSPVATRALAETAAAVLSTSPVATRALAETAAAAAQHRLPVAANTTLADFAVVSLSPDTEELGRQLGRQAARLLAGAEPSSVPVEDPNRFVLTLNAQVAADLGLSLPDDLLREANTVIG
jgi:putative tryptophan/tyrosine transport system substrate-binding protein